MRMMENKINLKSKAECLVLLIYSYALQTKKSTKAIGSEIVLSNINVAYLIFQTQTEQTYQSDEI